MRLRLLTRAPLVLALVLGAGPAFAFNGISYGYTATSTHTSTTGWTSVDSTGKSISTTTENIIHLAGHVQLASGFSAGACSFRVVDQNNNVLTSTTVYLNTGVDKTSDTVSWNAKVSINSLASTLYIQWESATTGQCQINSGDSWGFTLFNR